MKIKKKYFMLILVILIIWNTPIMSYIIINVCLFENRANYLPDNSSPFYFEPKVIDEGSGEYWRYGQDRENYYYFSEDEDNVYYYISKNNHCINFKADDFKSWCNPIKMNHKP